jgi:hypothetical protein
MARIVRGLATSHSPLLSTPPGRWSLHAERDRRNPHLVGRDGAPCGFDDLVATAPAGLEECITPQAWEAAHRRVTEAVDRLSAELHAARPDVVVAIGDDQWELFRDEAVPCFAVFTGAELHDLPLTDEEVARLAPGVSESLWARHAAQPQSYAGSPDLGRHLVSALTGEGFDMAWFAAQLPGRAIGHAFTFVTLRLMAGRSYPLLPVAVNAYFPPNQPSPGRCYDIGRALRRAIESFPGDLRVAVVASGGLSHFVVDEELDRGVLAAMAARDRQALAALPAWRLQSGSSEIRNWIVAAGVLEGLDMATVDYIPLYRTVAGTGVGAAFARWSEPDTAAPAAGGAARRVEVG